MRPRPASGLAALRRGLRLLASEPRLWPLAAAPVVVTVVGFAAAVWFFLSFALEPLLEGLRSGLAVADPEAWYGWVWVGPLRALAWLLRWVVLIGVAVAVYVTFTIVGGVVAAPFLDALSARVERLLTGSVVEVRAPGVGGLLAASLHSLTAEARRVAFFLSVQAGLAVLGLLPGMQVLTVPCAVAFAALFLPLDYCGFLFDRRGVGFRERRRWVWAHRVPVGLFGLAALLTFALPGANFLALPWLVTAGTLLALEIGPPAPGSGHPARERSSPRT